MQNFDLETMSLDELKSIKRDLDKAITNFDQRRKAEAKRDLEAKAREHGFSLAELVDAKGSKRGPVAAKYRNPENPDQTWSGRGRQPAWYKNALENGTDPDTLAI
jgi:DNA-binding protein H-NS